MAQSLGGPGFAVCDTQGQLGCDSGVGEADGPTRRGRRARSGAAVQAPRTGTPHAPVESVTS